MRVSLNWLRDYVDISLPVRDLAHRLTMNGLNVEEIFERDPFKGVIIGKVLEVTKHPNADKLSLTRVDIGSDILNIVCGAPNVQAGQLVAVAAIGTMMPGGFEIKKAKIRGEESNGMICSKSELGFEKDKSPGIWELDTNQSYQLGQAFTEFMKLGETVFEIDVTSNRPDCLNMLGIAREIAVIENKPLKTPKTNLKDNGAPIASLASVTVEDAEGCPRYAARVVQGVTIGPSPQWLIEKLEAVGLRSINNIVDITNFVMLECGQPLHAFDYDELKGRRIIVKKSKAGEKFQTLDGKFHELNDEAVMICDAERAIAIGGIMGGKNSEISDKTKNVLLESAHFNSKRIRRSSKFLGITSDASGRFGRGIDPEGTLRALDRATDLIMQFAGGSIACGIIDVVAQPRAPRTVKLRATAINKLLGVTIPESDAVSILEKLECRVNKTSGGEFDVTPPSFRLDLNIEEDLIEEIARIYGYDQIPNATGAYVNYEAEESKPERLSRELRATMREIGFSEAVTNSMVHPKPQLALSPQAEGQLMKIMNPISEDMSVMRTSMLPSLFDIIKGNLFRKNFDLQLYEIGKIYLHNVGNPLPVEQTIICGCATGMRDPIHWSHQSEPFDFFDLKSVILRICQKFMLDSIEFNPYNFIEVYAPNSLEISAGKHRLGHLGKIQKSILRHFDIDKDVWAFELDYAVLSELARFKKAVKPISRFPSIQRDLAMIVNKSISAGSLMDVIRANAGANLESLDVFDVYTGDQIASDKKSLAFSLLFQSPERTLTEEEIDAALITVISKVEKEFGAQLR
ncbi:phenylalanine--tRNA ligase subunit beta [bacterium]|nr:phenylalanine--tRNA ligase subunit beta [bacterium]